MRRKQLDAEGWKLIGFLMLMGVSLIWAPLIFMVVMICVYKIFGPSFNDPIRYPIKSLTQQQRDTKPVN
jgi:hypothetical protein